MSKRTCTLDISYVGKEQQSNPPPSRSTVLPFQNSSLTWISKSSSLHSHIHISLKHSLSLAMAGKAENIEMNKHPGRFDPNTDRSSYSSYQHLASVIQTDQVDGGTESREIIPEPGPRPLAALISSTLASQVSPSNSDGTDQSTSFIANSFDGARDEICSIDGLIAELESDTEEVEADEISLKKGKIQAANENLLQTDPILGLGDEEVTRRRRKFGFNQLNEEKSNHFKKLLGFFVGPIQFVMEVSQAFGSCCATEIDITCHNRQHSSSPLVWSCSSMPVSLQVF